MPETQEKIVYVWGNDLDPFSRGTTPTYCTHPFSNTGRNTGDGSAKSVAGWVRELMSKGYNLVLDTTPEGRRKPLDKEDYPIFLELIRQQGGLE
nr:hypothetical protein [uncultured archaeon]AQS34125.1 hypothetical protein [uncultured archaeon]